jgi:hypothetical protein
MQDARPLRALHVICVPGATGRGGWHCPAQSRIDSRAHVPCRRPPTCRPVASCVQAVQLHHRVIHIAHPAARRGGRVAEGQPSQPAERLLQASGQSCG